MKQANLDFNLFFVKKSNWKEKFKFQIFRLNFSSQNFIINATLASKSMIMQRISMAIVWPGIL